MSLRFSRWRMPALSALLVLAFAGPAFVAPALAQVASIAAVVNGTVITQGDVNNRARLFALSTGLPLTPDVLNRLAPQVTRQLIDERLQLQEVEKQHIVVPDKAIAAAIADIEKRNTMAAGDLRQKLAAQGVGFGTLIDQIRTQLGWTQVLRKKLGASAQPSPQDIADRLARIKAQTGHNEYNVGEIFIPIESQAGAADAQKFADTVITQLRAGAPFPVVAAQFSQSQTALQGGALGWVQPEQLDPGVAALVDQMPVGAISNPVPVAGGLSIVQLRGKRQIGNDPATVLTLRQVFLPFATPLNPQAPTAAQQATLQRAHALGTSIHSCSEMEAANKAAGAVHPSDPGPVQLQNVTPPQFQKLLTDLPLDQASPPLLANDGVTVVMICDRQTKNLGVPTKKQITQQILGHRVELFSQQLLADLHRRANIQMMKN